MEQWPSLDAGTEKAVSQRPAGAWAGDGPGDRLSAPKAGGGRPRMGQALGGPSSAKGPAKPPIKSQGGARGDPGASDFDRHEDWPPAALPEGGHSEDQERPGAGDGSGHSRGASAQGVRTGPQRASVAGPGVKGAQSDTTGEVPFCSGQNVNIEALRAAARAHLEALVAGDGCIADSLPLMGVPQNFLPPRVPSHIKALIGKIYYEEVANFLKAFCAPDN